MSQDLEGTRTSSEANADKMTDEERKANADRSDESGAVFFGGEHEDREDQERSEEHLNEESAETIRVG